MRRQSLRKIVLHKLTEIGHDEEGYACVTWKAINDAPTIIEAEVSGDDE